MRNVAIANAIHNLFLECDNVRGGKGYVIYLKESECIVIAVVVTTEIVSVTCTDNNTIDVRTRDYDVVTRKIYDCDNIRMIEVEEIVCNDDKQGDLHWLDNKTLSI